MPNDNPKEYIPTTREMMQKFEHLEIVNGVFLEYYRVWEKVHPECITPRLKEIVKDMEVAYANLG